MLRNEVFVSSEYPIPMGSCCSIDICNNKVGHEDTEEPESGCSTPESEMYLERITHIVADIHETVRHKDCSVRR